MVENCVPSICISRKYEYVGDPSQMRRPGTHWNTEIGEHFQFQLATMSQIGRWGIRTRFYMGYIGICPLKGYGFSAVLVINRVSVVAILVINRVWFLHSSLDMGMFLRRSHFFSNIEKKTNKCPS